MDGVQYVKDKNGKNTALLIDLETLKRAGNSGHDVRLLIEKMEELEDIIDIELSKGSPAKSYKEVRKALQASGKLKGE